MKGLPEAVAARIRAVCDVPDREIDLARAALALGGAVHPQADLARYEAELDLLADSVALAARGRHGISGCIGALREAVVERMGFEADEETYDDPRNANLLDVLDRRRGLPITLGILYLEAAACMGWDLRGLAFPSHFLLRLEHQGERRVLDPFQGAAPLGAQDMRALLKASAGNEAELKPEHYEPLGKRAILLRLQNNVKLRSLQEGRLDDVLRTVRTMMLVAPQEVSLWREVGLINVRLGRLPEAIEALETFLRRSPSDAARYHASTLVKELRAQLDQM